MIDDRKARDPELLDALDKLGRTQFDSLVWRVVRETRDVLQGSPAGARWDPGHFDVLYTSLEPNGALEEIYFHLSRQPVFPSIAFQIHRLHVRAIRVLDIVDPSILATLGVSAHSLSMLDYSLTQAIGDAAFFLGFDGLLVPSARSTATNLVVFSDRIGPGDIDVEHSEVVNWQAWRSSR